MAWIETDYFGTLINLKYVNALEVVNTSKAIQGKLRTGYWIAARMNGAEDFGYPGVLMAGYVSRNTAERCLGMISAAMSKGIAVISLRYIEGKLLEEELAEEKRCAAIGTPHSYNIDRV